MNTRFATLLFALGSCLCWSLATAQAQAQPPRVRPAVGDGAAGAKAPPVNDGEPKSNLIRSLLKMLDDEGAVDANEKKRVRDMLMEADAELARSGGANLMKAIMDANKKPVGFRVGGTRRRRIDDPVAPKKPGEAVKPSADPKSTDPKPVDPAVPNPVAPPVPPKTPAVEDPFAVPAK